MEDDCNTTEKMRIVHINASNTSALNFIKSALLDIKEKTNSHAIIMGKLHVTFSQLDRTTKQKINKETSEHNHMFE